MGFDSISVLNTAWTARLAHNEHHLTRGRNVVGTARALAYQAGVNLLAEHLDGMGAARTGVFGSVASVLPPELHGQALPVVALPHLLGATIGTSFGALMATDEHGPEMVEMKRALLATSMEMGLELIQVVIATAHQDAS